MIGEIVHGVGVMLIIASVGATLADCFADRAHILAALRNRLNSPDHSADKLADRGGGVGRVHSGSTITGASRDHG